MAERTMLDLDIDDAVEPTTVDADEEYRLRITSAHVTKSEKGTYLIPRMEVKGFPTAKEFTHVLTVPDPDVHSEKDLNRHKWNMSEFFKAFGFNYRGGEFDPSDDLPGLEGDAILGVRDDEQYGEQNFIKKLTVPK